jgi:hypothetical protein
MGDNLVNIKVKDSTGQQSRTASVPRDAQVGELIEALVSELNLPINDPSGRPVSYHLRHERSGVALSGTQTVGDTTIEEDDMVQILPEITPGTIQ